MSLVMHKRSSPYPSCPKRSIILSKVVKIQSNVILYSRLNALCLTPKHDFVFLRAASILFQDVPGLENDTILRGIMHGDERTGVLHRSAVAENAPPFAVWLLVFAQRAGRR